MASIGLILGVLYAAGALSEAGELRHAGYDPLHILPLLPLQAILGRGIAVATDPFALVLALLVTALVAMELLDLPGYRRDPRRVSEERRIAEVRTIRDAIAELREAGASGPGLARVEDQLTSVATGWDRAEDVTREVTELAAAVSKLAKGKVRSRTQRKVRTWSRDPLFDRLLYRSPRRVRYAAGVIVGVALAIFAPFAIVPFLVAVSVALAWISRSNRTSRTLVRGEATALVLVPLAATVFGAVYINPSPLPRTMLCVANGSVTGDLIASPGTGTGTWYIGTSRGRVVSVDSSRVARAEVLHVSHPRASQSLFTTLKHALVSPSGARRARRSASDSFCRQLSGVAAPAKYRGRRHGRARP